MTNLCAVTEFRRLAAVLTVNKLMTISRTDALTDYAMLSARFQESWAMGVTPSAALLSLRRKLAGDLGLLGMSLITPTAKPNRFLDNHLLRSRR